TTDAHDPVQPQVDRAAHRAEERLVDSQGMSAADRSSTLVPYSVARASRAPRAACRSGDLVPQSSLLNRHRGYTHETSARAAIRAMTPPELPILEARPAVRFAFRSPFAE